MVHLARHFQHPSAFTEEPGKAACPWPLLKLYLAMGCSCRISGDGFASLSAMNLAVMAGAEEGWPRTTTEVPFLLAMRRPNSNAW